MRASASDRAGEGGGAGAQHGICGIMPANVASCCSSSNCIKRDTKAERVWAPNARMVAAPDAEAATCDSTGDLPMDCSHPPIRDSRARTCVSVRRPISARHVLQESKGTQQQRHQASGGPNCALVPTPPPVPLLLLLLLLPLNPTVQSSAKRPAPSHTLSPTDPVPRGLLTLCHALAYTIAY